MDAAPRRPAIDLGITGIFSFVTGALADVLIELSPTSAATRAGMGRRVKAYF